MRVAERGHVAVDEFLDWVSTQEGRFELVDGYIVEMMAGAKQGHNVIVMNIGAGIHRSAKANGCRTTASDTAVRTFEGTVRYPDVVVDCGPPDPETTVADNPTLVVEVASPGTALVDSVKKLEEYRQHPAIRLIMLVEPSFVTVTLHRRARDGVWEFEEYTSLDDVIDLPEIGSTLSLSDIYDTLNPRVRSRLRLIDADDSPKPR